MKRSTVKKCVIHDCVIESCAIHVGIMGEYLYRDVAETRNIARYVMIDGVGKENAVLGLRIVHWKEIERWAGPEEITLNKLLGHHLRQETDSQSAR